MIGEKADYASASDQVVIDLTLAEKASKDMLNATY